MEPRFLVLLAFATAAIAGPITVQETNNCATECSTSTKLVYAPGTTYVYDYRVDYVTSMSGASEDSAKLTMTSTAELEVLGPCEMALSLRDTRLFHSDASGALKAADSEDYFRRGLETSALRFSYQDGVVDHVCAGNREEAWALNVKKGILSAFQNSMDDLSKGQNVTETDVAGTCETQYQTVSTGYYSDAVRKVKDILTCTDRHDYRTILQMVPYNVPSELQSIPLMKTTHECDQVIKKGGVLESSTCTEMHVYRPFSNEQSGGATTVKQALTYKTYSSGVSSRQDIISSRDSLVFDHSASRPSPEQARRQAEQKLKEICESTSYDVRPESPRLFSELVTALKALDKQTMEELFLQLKTKSMCPTNDKAHKMFLDALPMTSTSASVSLMTSLLTNEDVQGIEAKAWIASLALIKAPTSEMILDAKALVDSEKLRDDALLPVSAMVNNFCSKSSPCDQSYAVLSIMASLERNIGSGCDASGKNFLQTLLTLRAIGNAGHADRSVPVITKCLVNSYNPLEIRVAAANAFRRMPCEAESSDLWATYENADHDSELRVAAYLALMRCPSDANLARMAASLESEKDEQVGAFVYSHLTNLRESSDPHKQGVARALDNLAIPTKFEANPMKASINVETSALINKINTGFVAESNLVWSNNAQVPRSASANLTVELFGQSINLVDFGGRMEGLEHLIKNLFGPYLGEEEAKKAKPVSYDNVHGSVYGRFFGNEMLFVHSKQVRSPFDKFSSSWLDMLISLAKKQEVAFTHGGQFMDVSMIIPTVAGLPIHVDVNGSAVVDVLVSGKADFRKVRTAPRSLDVDGEIRPSAAMEVTGTMAVNAFVTRTGLRMRNTMHTSTSLKGRVQLERGQQLNVELDTPQDKMEIFEARSKFFILHNNVEQEQKMITENRKQFEHCSCDKTAEITGAQLCGQISFPNASMQSDSPYFPLTGPSSVSLVLRKTDTHTGYKLLAKRVENKKMSVAQISFNTPGSKVNRVILIDMSVNYPRKSVDAQIVTPWKKAALAGALVNSKDMKSLSGSITVDESDIYAWTSEVKVSKSKSKLHLSPMVEVRQPGMETVQLSGFVAMEYPMKSVDMDLTLTGMQKLPYNVKASVSNTKKERSAKVSFSKDGGKSQYSLDATNRFSIMGKKAMIVSASNELKVNTPKKEIVSMKATADYKEDKSLKLAGTIDIDRLMKKPASLKLDILKNAKKRGVRYDVDANIKSIAFTGRVDSNMFIKKAGLISTKTAVDYTIPKVAKNKVILSGKFNDRSTKAYTKYTLKSNLDVKKNPEYNMGVSFGFDHKKKNTEAELEIKYGPNPKDKTKRLYLSTALNRKIPNYKNAVLVYKMKAQAPEHKVDLLLAGKHTHNPKMVDSDVKLTYAKGKDISASVLLKDKTGKMANLNGRASIAWPGSEYFLSSKLDRKNSKLTHEINLKGSNGMKHSIDTVYKSSNGDGHMFSTVFNLQGLKKTTVSGSSSLQSKHMQVSGEVKYGKDLYGLSTKAKKSKSSGGSVIVEMFNPDRRVTMKLDGEKAKNKYEGKIETAWDADNDKNKKITLGGSVYNKQSKKTVSLGGDVSFTSPFENFENLASTFKYGSDQAQHDMTGKLSWGGKNKQIVSSLSLKKPISLSYFEGTIEAKTPFKKMRSAAVDISHKWENALNTILKGNLNKENAKLVLEGEGNLMNMKGSASLTSTIKNAEDVSGIFSHKFDSNNVASNVAINHNGDAYGYNLNMDHQRNGWQIKNNGDLLLTVPKSKLSTSWLHKNSDNMVKSQFTSKWGNKKFNVFLTGSHDLSSVRNINGELKIDSPWKSLGDVVVSVNHKNGDGLIKSKAEVIQNGETQAMSDVKYVNKDANADVDFTIMSPFHHTCSGKFNTKYGVYPLISVGEFQWHPRKKVTTETSLNADSWENAAFDFKVSTPFRGYRNVNFKASNQREGSEMISRANLDYGVRKSVDLETRHSLNGQQKMARVKLTTPFEAIESLDSGFRFDGHAQNFDSSADFELVPHVGKYQGSAKWRYDDDMTGTVRLDTPLPDYPYFELSASSNDKGKVRKSRVEARLHPRQVYSADAVYSFDLPISIEATINSPYPEYDNLGLVFQHNHSPSMVTSHGEFRYTPDKKIEGDLNADWSSNIEGNLIVKTPFPGYENNKLALRHQGDLGDFSSHAEVNVAEKSVAADASFNGGYTTTGTFTLTSPVPGMENVKFSLKKKGRAKNFKGDVRLIVNDDKFDADYSHKLTKDSLKSTFKLTSPYTENVKLSLDHNGMLERFTNEMSASYGRKYDIDSIVSFDYSHPDVTGHGTIKYKLGRRKETARLHFNKNGPMNDMSFSGSAGMNDDEINVSGAWKNRGSLEGHVKINTPFRRFRTTGMTLSHEGDLNDFRSSVDLTYMDNKNINGKISLASHGLVYVRLDSEIATPFKQFPSARLIFNHNFDEYSNMLNGDASLTTPAAEFGSGTLTYSKTGSLDNFDISTNAKMNGKQMGNFKLSHAMVGQEVHSSVAVEASDYPTVTLSFDHIGDMSSFNTKASGNLGRDNVFGEFSKRGPMDDLSVSGTARYNGDAVEMSGTWNSQKGLDGNLDIKTPFEDFNDIGASISHTGDASDFTSSARVEFMDNKVISGKVDVSSDGRFVSELSTPFQGFEYTKVEANGAFDSYSKDTNAKVSLTSTINEFGTGDASFSKYGSLDNLVVDGSILRNNIELGSLKLTNSLMENELRSAFNGKLSDLPEVKLTLDHNGDMSNFNTKAHASVGDRNVIEGVANFYQNRAAMNADATVTYDIENVGSNQGFLSFEKDGKLDDFNMKVTGRFNGQESTVRGDMKMGDEKTGSLVINTPLEGYNNVGVSFKHMGTPEKFTSEGQINLVDGEQYSGRVDFYRKKYQLIAEVNTPLKNAEYTKFEYRHDGQMDNFKCFASLEYGQYKKITYDMSAATSPNFDFSVSVKTPFDNYEDLMALATVETSWPQVSINSKMNAGNGRLVTLRGSLDASKDISGSLALSTPVEGFSDVGMSFEHSGKMKNFKSEGRVTYMDGKEISGKVVFKQRRQYLSAEMKTPFDGFEYTKYEWSKTDTRSESTTTTYLVYGNGKVTSSETVITFKPKPGFSIIIKSPAEDYEEITASASFDNSWPRFELNSKASIGRVNQVSFDAVFDASNDISGSVDVKTPMDGFNNVGLSFGHSGNSQKFDSEGKITYMDGKDIAGKVSFYKYMWRRLAATAELSTPFDGAKYTKGEINYEDNSNSISTTAALEYGNGQKMDGNMKLTYSPSYDAILTINTPFYEYRVIRAQGSLDVTAPSYSAGYSLNYGYNTAYSANGKLNLYSVDNVDGSLEVVLPIEGIEFTKAEYQHKFDSSRVDGSVSLTYGDGKVISSELKATQVPNYDANMVVKTPFAGYENMQGSISYDNSYNKYDASSSLNLGSGYSFSITSGLDLSAEPLRGSVQISTPYSDYRNMELVLTHEGSINDFRCTGFLSSPITESVNAATNFRYNTPFDMEASASVKSSFEGMDDLSAEIKNSDLAGEKKTHAVVGWTRGKQVALDALFRQQESWYENKLFGELSLSTPCDALRNLAMQAEHSGKQEETAQMFSLELNGEKLLDVDTEYSSKGKHQGAVTFRKPLPMKYAVSASSEAGVTETEVMANWNRDEMDSNVRVTAFVNDQSDSYKTDRSIDIGFEHASRKMGIVHKLSNSEPVLSSSGKIYWDADESSKVSYDMQIKDSSRRRKEVKEGHFTLGLPFRTVGFSGSYSDNRVVKTGDATFSWDADRDDKQVGLKGTITRGDSMKGDLTLSMPAIRKEIRVDGELMSQNGRIILDARTDISYSKDSRKTLTLTSKLEDISDYYSRYNYSLAVGVSHPYTNVDIQMTSHLGSSDEKMTLGLNTDYLTARRQNKNLGLLAEINKLKRQISLQVTNPVNKVEISGGVVSTRPYKVNMLSKVDDVERFRSDLTLDEDKKSVEINMFEGSDGLKLWAGYPKSTVFRSEISRVRFGRETTEALMAVRLNTTRLMHTRLHWDPNMAQKFWQAAEDRAVAGGAVAAETMGELNMAVAEELSGKYTDITNALDEELRPLIDALDKEMALVARKMNKLSREMRKAYESNTFYIQDMGQSVTEAYMNTQEKLAMYTREYREASTEIIQSLSESLHELTSYPVQQHYNELVSSSASWLNEKAESALSCLEAYLAKTDAALTEYHEQLVQLKKQATDSFYNTTYVNYLADIDVSPYIPKMEIPEEFTNAIYSAQESINNRLGDMLESPGLRYVKGGMNEVYQQGVWAYNYWQVEENIHAHAQRVLKLIREIVQDELQEYVHELQGLYQNPVTVWMPEQGEVQAEFKLPVDVASLEEMPDFSPLMDQLAASMPDTSALEKVSETLSDLWEASEDEDEVVKQLKKYKPSKKMRKAKKGRKYRVRKARN